ncbi:hypothetical protein BCT35_18150 [Vibrio lentus]|uniref:retron Ec48 family effector membrane protein n=1 Tax=Vibrio lentus TaxID=136468 RepID=UPI000C860748|nr:retron Ec48 family effector membrane protein [Vibrio lentus]PML43805.1 hypothetical protein BCT75_08085 [Vibrio lentus]PMN30801.1 hypothetical protein BCT35_18150 [Vibrio lentus]
MINEIRKYPRIIATIKIFFLTCTLALLLIILALGQTIIEDKIYLRPLCFSNSCLEETYKQFKYIIDLAFSVVSIFTSLLTSFGIFIAALTFFNTSKTNALNSHINHFKIFSDYLSFEVNKRGSIHLASIDVFTWYNLIFQESKEGSISVSNDYKNAINIINSQILISNEQSTIVTNGSYKYKDHQKRMIEALSKIGINLQLCPRNDFIMIEGDFHNLIDTINSSFCSGYNIPKLKERLYK